jgi:hypothetical protein
MGIFFVEVAICLPNWWAIKTSRMIFTYFLANFFSAAKKNLPLKKGRSPEVSYLTYSFRAKCLLRTLIPKKTWQHSPR